ncbi:DUF4381 domain-containing protein [Marichromatium bheemlicum]|uniref:DUF4381 domain-containing protein n=1 Tax=Marichromatium bheemlicum TaxID=365339 RepID=A0ABX1I8X9_9GAMM|nr:DUF4381 domain-containing protein [Marichromatium bheemlicum]NKN32601.1 DUF4381 domain-containing protein [Marichromatium bheemlicum]
MIDHGGLRDIHDIGAVPWWPPAPGWWLLAFALGLGGWLLWRSRTVLGHGLLRLIRARSGWRTDARRQLHALAHRERTGEDPARLLAEFSELLRRIAIARCGRDGVAGRCGESWLAWLERADPTGFPWRAHGQALIGARYAPPAEVTETALAPLIMATLAWTRAAPYREGGDA